METFENRDLSYSCEWADVLKYDDIMPSFWSRSSVGTFDSKYTDFFLVYMEEKVSFFENIRLCVDGQIRFENATCGRRFF